MICPLPPRMGSRMTGALTTLPSSTIANGRLTLAWVVSPKRLAPAESKRKVTDGRPLSSNEGCASTSRSPLTITRLRTTYCRGLPAPSTSSADSSRSDPAGMLPRRASATEVPTSTRRNTILAVRPSRRLMRSGSSMPGSWTRMRSGPWRWMVGSRTPVSSMRRRTISIDCSTAELRASWMASSVSVTVTVPSAALATSMSSAGPPTPSTPVLIGLASPRISSSPCSRCSSRRSLTSSERGPRAPKR